MSGGRRVLICLVGLAATSVGSGLAVATPHALSEFRMLGAAMLVMLGCAFMFAAGLFVGVTLEDESSEREPAA